jgi:tetratricopeptide (TPR) repeat protein
VERQRGRLRAARGHYESSLAVAREIGNRHAESVTLRSMGGLAVLEGRLEAAVGHFEASLERFRDLDTTRGMAAVLVGLGRVCLLRGELQRSHELLQEALVKRRAIRGSELDALFALIALHLESDRPDQARSLAKEVTSLLEDKQFPGARAYLGAYQALMGDVDPGDVEVPESLSLPERAELNGLLFRAGGGRECESRCRQLLDQLAAELDERDREQFWHDNPAARHLRTTPAD